MHIRDLGTQVNSTHIGIFYLLLAVWIAPFAPLQYQIAIGMGESMEPIESGDIIIYQHNTLEQAQEGDIIVFETQGKAVAHEYISSGVTKGINNESADPTIVTDDNYNGEVQLIIPTSNLLP